MTWIHFNFCWSLVSSLQCQAFHLSAEPWLSPGVSWRLGPALGAGHQGEQCQWRDGGLPSPWEQSQSSESRELRVWLPTAEVGPRLSYTWSGRLGEEDSDHWLRLRQRTELGQSWEPGITPGTAQAACAADYDGRWHWPGEGLGATEAQTVASEDRGRWVERDILQILYRVSAIIVTEYTAWTSSGHQSRGRADTSQAVSTKLLLQPGLASTESTPCPFCLITIQSAFQQALVSIEMLMEIWMLSCDDCHDDMSPSVMTMSALIMSWRPHWPLSVPWTSDCSVLAAVRRGRGCGCTIAPSLHDNSCHKLSQPPLIWQLLAITADHSPPRPRPAPCPCVHSSLHVARGQLQPSVSGTRATLLS